MAYLGRTKTPAPLTSADIPDGIVTAADLAPDSVGTSEIADSVTLVTPNLGTVATGNLSNTAIVYPAGHVIQVVSVPSTTAITHGGSSYSSSYKIETTITPKYSNSKIWAYITGTWQVYAGNNNINKLAFLALFEDTVSTIRVHTRVGLTFSSALSMDAYGAISLQYLADAGTAGVAQTFGICSKTNGSSYNNSIQIGESSYPTVITLMEIKV